MNYVYTIRGSRSEEDAIEFMIGILMTEYCGIAGDEARVKGFRRTLAQTNEEIDKQLTKMHINSPGRYAYSGMHKGLPVYIFFGVTQFQRGVTHDRVL